MNKSENFVNLSTDSLPDKKKSGHGGLIFIIVCSIAVLFGIIWVIHYNHRAAAEPADTSRSRGGSLPVPVVTGSVKQKDVPIYLDGLGTVQALNSVAIRSRVDGQLIKVAFTEGQDVKAGDLLVQIDPAPYQAVLDQTIAKKAQDEAQLANALIDLQRYTKLIATNSISGQVYDTQKALADQRKATVRVDDAAIDAAKVNLNYTTIRAPIDGRTGIRGVDQGNIVLANDPSPLVVLKQLRPISIVFTLPETVLSKLQGNQNKTDFTVLAVDRDNKNVLATGRLTVIDNQIDSLTGTIKLKATFSNENLQLWPGQFVNTRLLLTTRIKGVVVPASVVQRGPEGPFAFVVQNDQTVKMRPLKIAQIDNGEALIDDGLQVGECVVVDGQYKLQDGSHVKSIEPSAGAPENTAPKKREHKKP